MKKRMITSAFFVPVIYAYRIEEDSFLAVIHVHTVNRINSPCASLQSVQSAFPFFDLLFYRSSCRRRRDNVTIDTLVHISRYPAHLAILHEEKPF